MEIVGRSIAARGSCFYLRELRCLLDCGTELDEIENGVSIILITHGHDDHHKMLYSILSMYHTHPPKVYVPTELVEHFREHLNSTTILNTFSKQTECDYVKYIIGVSAGDEFLAPDENYQITAFKTFHGEDTPSIGYTVSKRKSVMKKEYRNYTIDELITLVKSSKTKTKTKELVYAPVCVYTGDTTPKVFQSDYMKSLLNIDGITIITECTFKEEENKERAEKTFHTHYDDLKPILEAYPKVNFRLTHFSARYRHIMLEIKKEIEETHKNTKVI